MPRLSTRPLLAGGVIGPPLFVVVLLVEGATRPGYSAWRHYGSQLATGEGGWMQVANFIICGLKASNVCKRPFEPEPI